MTADAKPDPDEAARRLAAEAIAAGDPTAWFERLYDSAARGDLDVPWDRGGPHPLLAEWAERHDVHGAGRRAMVVGSGLGDDAELIASLGFATTAFDVSDTAVAMTRARFPDSAVEYRVASLLDLPPGWELAFDLVVESLTVQALPRSLRAQAIGAVRGLVAPGGTLLVISGALGGGDPDDGPPWRLSRAELDRFAADGLTPAAVEELPDATGSGASRWRANFVRT